MQRTFAQLSKSLLPANLFSTTASGAMANSAAWRILSEMSFFSNFLLVSDECIPPVKLVHHVIEVLRPVRVHDHGQKRHGIIRGSGLEPERHHPPSVEPIDFQHCFELNSYTTSTNYGSERLLTPPSGSSRQDSHAQTCQNTQVRLDLSQELREALLVHTVCCAKLLRIAVAELGLLLLWGVDHADCPDCSAVFHFYTFFSLARRRGKPLEFKLYLVQLGCLPRELGGHSHEIFFHAIHAIQSSRGLDSRH